MISWGRWSDTTGPLTPEHNALAWKSEKTFIHSSLHFVIHSSIASSPPPRLTITTVSLAESRPQCTTLLRTFYIFLFTFVDFFLSLPLEAAKKNRRKRKKRLSCLTVSSGVRAIILKGVNSHEQNINKKKKGSTWLQPCCLCDVNYYMLFDSEPCGRFMCFFIWGQNIVCVHSQGGFCTSKKKQKNIKGKYKRNK